MNLLTLFIYTIAMYGIANTVIYAHGPFHIFDKLHEILPKIHPQLEEMMSCFICSGWWYGFLFSALNLFIFTSVAFTPMNIIGLPISSWYITLFLDGAYTSGSIWLVNTIQDTLERYGNNGQ